MRNNGAGEGNALQIQVSGLPPPQTWAFKVEKSAMNRLDEIKRPRISHLEVINQHLDSENTYRNIG